MKKYIVNCTRIYNGTIEVEADSKDDAIAIAQERIDEVCWEYGESTADYADEIRSNH